jgi:hypothetical protein
MNLALMKPRMEEERKTARERASCKEEEQISAAQVRARSTFLTKTIFTDSAQGTENEDRKNKSRKGETDTAREEDKRERKERDGSCGDGKLDGEFTCERWRILGAFRKRRRPCRSKSTTKPG